jgi:exosortase/archaeosortase
MTQVWNWTWLTVAFLAELGALAALAAWGWSTGGSTVTRVLLAVAAAGGAAVLWGVFAAPQAPVQITALSVVVKIVVFGAGVLALVDTGHPRLAVLLGAAAVLSSVLSTPPPS